MPKTKYEHVSCFIHYMMLCSAISFIFTESKDSLIRYKTIVV